MAEPVTTNPADAPQKKSEAPPALALLKDWSTWLVGLQTGAVGLSSFVVGKDTSFGLNVISVKTGVVFFGLSVVFATFVLASIPDIARRMLDNPSANFYHMPLFDQDWWSPFSHISLWVFTLAQHVLFLFGLICVVVAIVLGNRPT
jgi:hypothetical protein